MSVNPNTRRVIRFSGILGYRTTLHQKKNTPSIFLHGGGYYNFLFLFRFDLHHHPHVHSGVRPCQHAGPPGVHKRDDGGRRTVRRQRGGRVLQFLSQRVEVSEIVMLSSPPPRSHSHPFTLRRDRLRVNGCEWRIWQAAPRWDRIQPPTCISLKHEITI